MYGSAMLAIVASSTTMSCARQITTSAMPRFLCVAVAGSGEPVSLAGVDVVMRSPGGVRAAGRRGG